ncbi:DegV family protein [Lapidilactobacillus gannanensis]|jgi:DegV family protein with EDD domain|uniref:DegV family protein n=1 Tax=Lapidilactobacillus gannanensis TaxID=2486002 RepID=A0ABW4BRB1_9LACO|nr:DegV family protein [Lapidilactobacillus gannanensis]MCH4056670.1 DegV family protein [Lactobacillaceae bacterium]
MQDYILSCCSTADLSAEHFEKMDIHYVCFHFSLDGKQYLDDFGQSISFKDFYGAMANGATTATSQVNVEEFVDYFTPFLEAGQDILHVSLSSGLSGVINSANIAKGILAERFPERKIYIVDSLGASSGYGLIMNTLAEKKAAGMDLDSLHNWIETHKLEMNHWFFSTTLEYYIKGGRISKTAGFVGSLLGICPLLNMDENGKLIPREKIRGKKRVIKKIVDRMAEHAEGGLDYSGRCYISNADCYEDARAVADLVEERFTKLAGPVEINHVGTTIGSHTGPGTVALFFWGDSRQA